MESKIIGVICIVVCIWAIIDIKRQEGENKSINLIDRIGLFFVPMFIGLGVIIGLYLLIK